MHFVYIIRLSNIFMIKHKKNHVSCIEFIIGRKVNKEGLQFTSQILLRHVIQTIAKYEYVEIFLTEILQCLQRRHWGYICDTTFCITQVVSISNTDVFLQNTYLMLDKIRYFLYSKRCIFINLCSFTFGHCVVCPTSIYGLWLSFWYLQSLHQISLHP